MNSLPEKIVRTGRAWCAAFTPEAYAQRMREWTGYLAECIRKAA